LTYYQLFYKAKEVDSNNFKESKVLQHMTQKYGLQVLALQAILLQVAV
jgi:hypothetical protein